MQDRTHGWLDGDIPLEALDPQERSDALTLDAAIRATAARIAAVPIPDLTDRVMAALPAPGPAPVPIPSAAGAHAVPSISALGRLRRWLTPAGGLTLRPAAALAALGLVVGFALGTVLSGRASTGGLEGGAAPLLFVRFEVEAGGAREVRLAGSFTGWEPRLELTPVHEGRWSVTVPLEPGVHDYVFVVDGERYLTDPHAAQVSDGFGGFNSRLALLAPAL